MKEHNKIISYVGLFLLFLLVISLIVFGACAKKNSSSPAVANGTESTTATSTTIDKKNTPPSMPGVSINPNPATTNTRLTVVITSPSIDIDGDNIKYSYKWYMNGVITPQFTSAIITAENVKRNQVWKVEVVPNDGKQDGLSSAAEVTIQNSPPTSPTLKYSPDIPVSSKDIKVIIEQRSFDFDRDTVTYSFQWYKDGILQTSLTSDLVSSNNLSKGQSWRCVVTPSDGITNGNSAEVNIIIASEFISSDYFPSDEGYGIRYHVTDDYDQLICNIWAVFQHHEADRHDKDPDFLLTLTKEGTTGGFWNNSVNSGSYATNFSGTTVTMLGNGSSGNQAHLYFHFTLPSFFSSGDHWSLTHLGNYFIGRVESQTVNGIEFNNCIKVDIDTSNDTSGGTYSQGKGYFILAEGVGIVKFEFVRTTGQKLLIEYLESRQFERHTISGKVVVPQSLISVYGMPVVQISPFNCGNRSVVDSNGSFSVQIYGPDIEIMIGFDKDNNDIIDTDYKRKEYVINNISGDVGGLLYILN